MDSKHRTIIQIIHHLVEVIKAITMMSSLKVKFITCLLLLIFTACGNQRETQRTLLFVGSFTNKMPGEGIHIYEFDSESATTHLIYTLDSVVNTSFLKLSQDGSHLYSVWESQMPYHGKVAAFEVDLVNDNLRFINAQDCGGKNPVHLDIDKTGNYLTNSNYTDPSLSVFKIKLDGSLKPFDQVFRFKDSSVIESRQEEAHIHSSNFSPDNNFLFAQDLGADKIRAFQLKHSSNGSILREAREIKVDPGSGPRHFTFHPNGNFGYGVSELSGKILAFKYDSGKLKFLKDYDSYQQDQDIYRAADIHISPDGRFLYASNRAPEENSISIFKINEDNGELKLVGHKPTYGKHPRNFAISPDGEFLFVANQFSNTIVIFKIDKETGMLEKMQEEIKVNEPSSIQMHQYKIK
ncbi:MAG: lactonase family protein [Leeuwenhoekiella sp.]